jgi:tetratricopeptide (TPR) repeat protein
VLLKSSLMGSYQMRRRSRHALGAIVLGCCVALVALGQAVSTLAAPASVDPKAEVAAALYATSATQAAAERAADAKLRTQRKEIDAVRAKVQAGTAQHQAELTAAEEKYVAELAARDRAYAHEIAVFRKAVEDIAATPEGAEPLARFNAGDEPGTLTVLDQLRAARDEAREKRADLESAAEGRWIATLALEARTWGKFITAQVITRYEEVTRLDPGVPSDWVELGRLYRDAGNLPAALRAAQAAAKTAADERDQAVANEAIGDMLVAQGNLPAALTSYRVSLGIAETLAKRDTRNGEWQRDLIVSYVAVEQINQLLPRNTIA